MCIQTPCREVLVRPNRSYIAEVRRLTRLLMGVNFVLRQCMHVEASLSGTQTAACSVAGFLLAVEEGHCVSVCVCVCGGKIEREG